MQDSSNIPISFIIQSKKFLLFENKNFLLFENKPIY